MWTPEQDNKLRKLYETTDHETIGKMLGKTRAAVRNRCWRLGLIKKEPEWTDDEKRIIQEHYTATKGRPLRLKDLAKMLDRSEAAIAIKASRWGFADIARKKTETPKIRRRKFETAEERGADRSKRMKAWMKENGHPRGATGLKHTPEARARMSAGTRRKNENRTPEQLKEQMDKMIATKMERYGTAGNRLSTNAFSSARRGKREDLDGKFFRSSWEANYARYLNLLKEQGQIKDWEYEPKTFVFHGVTRGALTYTPDFKVIENDGSHVWHEVKGWMTSQSKTKLKRMAKYFPDEKVIVIGEAEYKAISKVAPMIPAWEYKGKAKLDLTDINWNNVEIVSEMPF